MKYREAAVRISQSVLMIMRELDLISDFIFEYEKEGEISKEESTAFMETVQDVLEKLMSEVGDPVFKIYPDLLPKCRSCEQGNQPDND